MLLKKPELPSKDKRYYQIKGSPDPKLMSKNARKNKHKTPWSQFNPKWLKSA